MFRPWSFYCGKVISIWWKNKDHHHMTIVYKPAIDGFSQKAAEAIWKLYYPKNIIATNVSKSKPVKHSGVSL